MVAILTTHPIQYQVPLWQALARDGRVPFEVWYLTNHGAEISRDRELRPSRVRPNVRLSADRQRVTNIGANAGGKPKFEIVNAARQKTLRREHVPAKGARGRRYPAGCRTDRDHIAETCRRTHGAAEIGAVCERGHSCCDGDSRTARGATGCRQDRGGCGEIRYRDPGSAARLAGDPLTVRLGLSTHGRDDTP